MNLAGPKMAPKINGRLSTNRAKTVHDRFIMRFLAFWSEANKNTDFWKLCNVSKNLKNRCQEARGGVSRPRRCGDVLGKWGLGPGAATRATKNLESRIKKQRYKG